MKILLADDHLLTLRGVRSTLEQVEDIEVVGETRSGSEVLGLVARTKPDMVLMDVRMPGIDGLACLDLLRRHHPNVKVVLLSAYSEREQIQDALERGAAGYIVKSVNPLDLPSALRQAFEGTVYNALGTAPQAGGARGAHSDTGGLTERELTILRAVASGLSNRAISKEMWVTEQTVKFHLTNIYRKLGVANRTAAARYAHSHGLDEGEQHLASSPG
jgi:DNA-binding NarL/FixJ family response regulator